MVDSSDPFVPSYPEKLFFLANTFNLDIFLDKLNKLVALKSSIGKKVIYTSKRIKIGLALRECLELLKNYGGRVFTFSTTDMQLPSVSKIIKKKVEDDDYEDRSYLHVENVGRENEKDLYTTKVL